MTDSPSLPRQRQLKCAVTFPCNRPQRSHQEYLMRTKSFAAGLLAAVTLVGCSSTRDTAVREALVPKASPEAALDCVLPAVEPGGLPLDEAIARLEAAAKVRIAVDWPRLDAAGVRRDQRVELRVRAVRLSAALSHLLEQASFAVRG